MWSAALGKASPARLHQKGGGDRGGCLPRVRHLCQTHPAGGGTGSTSCHSSGAIHSQLGERLGAVVLHLQRAEDELRAGAFLASSEGTRSDRREVFAVGTRLSAASKARARRRSRRGRAAVSSATSAAGRSHAALAPAVRAVPICPWHLHEGLGRPSSEPVRPSPCGGSTPGKHNPRLRQPEHGIYCQSRPRWSCL